MIIKPLIRDNLPDYLAYHKKVYHESLNLLPWDYDTVELHTRGMLMNPNARLLISMSDNESIMGSVAGIVVAWPFHSQIMTFHEYFVGGRGASDMRKQIYSWAKERGAQAVIKLCVSNEPGARVTYIDQAIKEL